MASNKTLAFAKLPFVAMNILCTRFFASWQTVMTLGYGTVRHQLFLKLTKYSCAASVRTSLPLQIKLHCIENKWSASSSWTQDILQCKKLLPPYTQSVNKRHLSEIILINLLWLEFISAHDINFIVPCVLLHPVQDCSVVFWYTISLPPSIWCCIRIFL